MKSKYVPIYFLILAIAAGFIFYKMINVTNVTQPNTTDNTPVVVASVIKEDITVGNGAEAVAGKTVSVNYVGKLTDGTEFDSSLRSGQPMEFVLGQSGFIEGWSQGIAGMKVGGKRKVTIPPELGYGENPMGKIPANSTLIFEIDLLSVKD
jgi:FKBP-type peptidyl-prolyl cis-trans isomerase FkpA